MTRGGRVACRPWLNDDWMLVGRTTTARPQPSYDGRKSSVSRRRPVPGGARPGPEEADDGHGRARRRRRRAATRQLDPSSNRSREPGRRTGRADGRQPRVDGQLDATDRAGGGHGSRDGQGIGNDGCASGARGRARGGFPAEASPIAALATMAPAPASEAPAPMPAAGRPRQCWSNPRPRCPCFRGRRLVVRSLPATTRGLARRRSCGRGGRYRQAGLRQSPVAGLSISIGSLRNISRDLRAGSWPGSVPRPSSWGPSSS